MKKNLNNRCPLQAECERKCEHEGHELDCIYYETNARPGFYIDDQEEIRRRRDRKREEEMFEAMAAEIDDEDTPAGVDVAQGEIVHIPVEQLFPHPDNPRKDLGDLTELADSIKANGILQNLTVVPRIVTGEITGDTWQKGYTVVIGHRRLAGAKRAGLKTLPCVIVKMSKKEQIQTMLLENMQRADLSTYEQAQGFQMMLDLGDTVEEISEKTGFSQTTVRRRVKLLDLDRDKFKASEERGATLQDYMELDKVEDPELKNLVLDAIGTENFRVELKKAIEKEENRKFIAERVSDVSQWATQIEDAPWDKYSFVRNYSRWNWKKGSVVEKPKDADTVNYYFRVGQQQVDIYTDKAERQETEEDRQRKAKREAEERTQAELREITERHFYLRSEFIMEFGQAKKYLGEICQFAAGAVIGSGVYCRDEVDAELLTSLLDLDIDIENADYEDLKAEALKAVAERPEYGLLVCAYASVDEGENGYWERDWDGDKGEYVFCYAPNDDLDRLYNFLCTIGYEMSDEERAMMDGSHEIFNRS